MRRTEYYRAEADRVQRLAESAERGHGREQFERVAAEYRSLAEYYDILPSHPGARSPPPSHERSAVGEARFAASPAPRRPRATPGRAGAAGA